MSEFINNREKLIPTNTDRITMIKQTFHDLHNGRNLDEIKAHFDAFVGSITIDEITQLQQYFADEGGIPTDKLLRIYHQHSDIFNGKIEVDQKSLGSPEGQPGHPIHTFKLENREIEKLLETRLEVHLEQFIKEDSADHIFLLIEDINLLLDIDKHYSRKENLIFPYLEHYGIYGPTTNMWRINDFIRDAIKETKQKLTHYNGDKQSLIDVIQFVIQEVTGMVYKEENILFPMAIKNFSEDEWVKIAHESDQIGYCLIAPAEEWKPERKRLDEKAVTEGFIKLETGILSLKQLELMLNHLPIDITFIDQDDVVRYFSHGKERIFARTKAIIGRTVQNCHPPRSVHVVESILDDFKAGKKDSEDFWIQFKDKYVYIRYFAVRDEDGTYKGTLEFTQNIASIKMIDGEKRILS
jgi:DUF438 domain-containing protein